MQAHDIAILGPAGVGKTTLAKYVVGQLAQTVIDLRWGYCNCSFDTNRRALLHSLAEELGAAKDIKRRGADPSIYIDRLQAVDDPIVVIVDEAAMLRNPETLTTLYDLHNLTVIAITVDERTLLDQAQDQRLESRFRSSKLIRLAPYSHSELRDILQDRARKALTAGAVTKEALDKIVEIADGDARLGIRHLRESAYDFPEYETNRITADLIEAVSEKAHEKVRERHLSSLNTEQRLLVKIIDEAGEIDAQDLHEEYERRSDDPRSKPTRRRYLRRLEGYKFIESTGTGRGTIYRSVLYSGS
jgi:Cdc6-like AAA superfamily ATPase